uniref:Transmembrane protein n=1 Tax=Heterorhabditis bacteriophora TaxID=37862 RepID=A0A1I7WQ20_HETBA
MHYTCIGVFSFFFLTLTSTKLSLLSLVDHVPFILFLLLSSYLLFRGCFHSTDLVINIIIPLSVVVPLLFLSYSLHSIVFSLILGDHGNIFTCFCKAQQSYFTILLLFLVLYFSYKRDSHVDSYKTEMLTRKEEDDLSEGYINDSRSDRDTPIVTAAPLAEIAQPANSTLPYQLPQLAECIKFYHLKNLLRGEAAQIISGLNTDSYNYSVAISLLTDAYGNTDDICHKLRAQVISFSITGQTAPTMLKS